MQRRKAGQPHAGWKGAARIKFIRPEDCPYFHDHTPSPEGYIQWHAWAKKMGKTHKQERCSGCNRWSIWVPKKASTITSHKDTGHE